MSQDPITRRGFVAGSLVTGAAAALPGGAEATAKHHPKHNMDGAVQAGERAASEALAAI